MAKPLMIQGTASNAGKSLLVTALCRIFRQDGFTVAPFKAQNMALNSYITAEGLEIGRAQAVQAEAAGIAPTADMNPILLKPSSDTGSQVIVNGEVWGNMSAQEYYAKKKALAPVVREAYRRLADRYDIVVLEGAGSPAEINLKADDLVNMGMAAMAQSPVLLCGDIDRGGVFASLAGTLLLLEPEERDMVKGLIVNKFRGDREILRPGLDEITRITGVPVVGVAPYLHVDIDAEDSLSDRLTHTAPGAVDIAVIRLPRISNFTDFGALELADGVSVRYVSRVSQLGHPDLLILPGTKSTMEDLLWMRQCGLESAVKKYAASGGIVFGVCGGYQMLGEELRDPDGVEHGGTLAGMGLLPGFTRFAPKKTRTRATGRFGRVGGALAGLTGVPLTGYEIHMGVTESQTPLTFGGEQGAEGPGGGQRGNVYGTYYHGVFDGEPVVRALVKALCGNKGMEMEISMPDPAVYREAQYDLLADGIRASLDMGAIYRILDAGLS